MVSGIVVGPYPKSSLHTPCSNQGEAVWRLELHAPRPPQVDLQNDLTVPALQPNLMIITKDAYCMRL
jgi:hypothetical protein